MSGRPRLPGTKAQRAEARRHQVKENVRAFRRRNRDRALSSQNGSSDTTRENPRRNSLTASEPATTTSSQGVTPTEENEPVQSPKLTSICDGQMIKWSLALPLRIDMGPAYANAFIAAFHDQSLAAPIDEQEPILTLELPVWDTEVLEEWGETIPRHNSSFHGVSPATTTLPSYIRVEICYCRWTTSITFESMSEGSWMLKEALLAAALNLLSIRKQNLDMVVQATQVQTRALRRLREGFDAYVRNNDQKNAALLSATAMAISVSELLVNKSWSRFFIHLQGVGALIEHAGPSSLKSELARHHLREYRTVQLPFSILNRKATFLARPEWINNPWLDQRSEVDADNELHSLLDIAYQLPLLMETYDKTIGRDASASRRLLNNLNKIASALNHWQIELVEEYSSSFCETQPGFWGGLHAGAIEFHSQMAAYCFTLYAAVRIALFSLVRQLADDLKDLDETAQPVLSEAIAESFKWSRIACQCIKHFFVSVEAAAGRPSCLLAFECAWSTFIELKQKYQMDMKCELLWCIHTAKRISAAGLPVFNMRKET
jgi:hypothetical protein